MEISNIESKLDEAISIPKNTISHPSTFKESIKQNCLGFFNHTIETVRKTHYIRFQDPSFIEDVKEKIIRKSTIRSRKQQHQIKVEGQREIPWKLPRKLSNRRKKNLIKLNLTNTIDQISEDDQYINLQRRKKEKFSLILKFFQKAQFQLNQKSTSPKQKSNERYVTNFQGEILKLQKKHKNVEKIEKYKIKPNIHITTSSLTHKKIESSKEYEGRNSRPIRYSHVSLLPEKHELKEFLHKKKVNKLMNCVNRRIR